jgi:hypothetical protein
MRKRALVMLPMLGRWARRRRAPPLVPHRLRRLAVLVLLGLTADLPALPSVACHERATANVCHESMPGQVRRCCVVWYAIEVTNPR